MATLTSKRLKRKDSFFGLHFDFHAGQDCTAVGCHVTPAMVRQIIAAAKPDYIQCDCKGHPGIASYPTRVGHPAPGFVRDQLKIWRRVTAEAGVALYMHYSGVWDNAAVKHHPSWAAVDADGTRNANNTSVFGPYADKLLIPQLKELRDEYDVDGVWIDGDCWAACQDYSKAALAAFRKATGIRTIPRKVGDPCFFEFTEFCRKGFRDYLSHYVDALHAHDPEFQIASNWAFSSFMPEPVSINVDFLSGDYSLRDSVRTARLEARYLAQQGRYRPWDLMAWSFSGKFGEGGYSTKTPVQLQQEAAVVLSQGGGFQAYFQQKRDGSTFNSTIPLMAAAAAFCRARQKVCHKSTPVPQVGLLLPTGAFYRKGERLFGAWGGKLVPTQGILSCLLDGQNVVDVVSAHHLASRMNKYPLLVLPEWGYLAPAFKRGLIEYVRHGGRLLLVGPEAGRLFSEHLGVKRIGKPEETVRYLDHDGVMAGIKTVIQDIRPLRGTTAFGCLYTSNDRDGAAMPAATIRKFGKGQIAAIHFNLGERCWNAGTTVLRDFLNSLVRLLFPRPIVEVTGSHTVDVALQAKDGNLAVHLVNTAGPHADQSVYTYDEIPAIGPLDITVRSHKRPKAVRLEPGSRKLRFTYAKGRIKVKLPELAIHSAIVVEKL